ncbi:hypothetical protein [Herbaspirillum seropedicae]|uniref:hypothetical protein n=1 Tax=Herbaspirillum seropedicae TaxID=964 RepID=UPI0008480A4E|nr:hypothetical protein [Herbaspirillum seropedicae]AON55774.1 hypothetical protein Hsc_3508 [Herbaspirillum seropedicae]
MKNRGIAAPDLATAMRWFVSSLANPGFGHFFVSTDHSPSEQIYGQEWHHSILILSQNVEHQAIADELGAALNPRTGKLKQWKHADQHYKSSFHQAIFHTLKKHPVLIYGTSAKESAVLQHEAAFADALGITGCYRRIEMNSKTNVEFGPYFRSDDNHPQTLTVSEKHAPMAIYLAHSLLRVHTHLQAAVAQQAGCANVPIWFQVMSDKPPTDFTGPYADLMWLLLGGPATAGKFTWGGFKCEEDQPIDLLADNLAGMINDITIKPNLYMYQGSPLEPPISGVFYRERLE